MSEPSRNDYTPKAAEKRLNQHGNEAAYSAEVADLRRQRDELADALEAALPLLADSILSASPSRQAEIQAVSAAARIALRNAGRLS